MADFVLLEDVEIKAVTAKAILVVVEDEEKWVPLSCLDLDETNVEFKREARGDIAVKRWFAEKEGLSG